MENQKGYYKQKSALWRSLRDGDFEEADVWAVLRERKDPNYLKVDKSFGIESPFQGQSSRKIPSPARMIPRTNSSSSSNNSTDGVQIPDGSKISNKKSKKKALIKKNYHDGSDDDDGVLDGDDDDDDVYDCKVPPHEFIAERLAKRQISSFSVFEGVGRTLKGRDLSEVRNAVLTRTGFLE